MSASAPILPYLWFDTQAEEAARLYTSLFPDPDTHRGDASGIVPGAEFELAGQPVVAFNAGPLFHFNPSISFFVQCDTADEVDTLYAALSEGGMVMMPLQAYPFSERFAWVADRYGLSWQLNAGGGSQKVTPFLLYAGDQAGRAEEAMRFYTSLFEDSAIEHIEYWGADEEGGVPGGVKQGLFRLRGRLFRAMDSVGHEFTFTEAFSLLIPCETQAEIDRFWAALSADPDAEQCGWCKDGFGVSWQVAPVAMLDMLKSPDAEAAQRVVDAFMPMKKLEIEPLRRAFAGEGA